MDPIDRTWCAWEGVHGGFALALAVEVGSHSQNGLPRAMHGTFFLPVPAERHLDVTTTELRRGKSSTDLRVEVSSGSVRSLEALFTLDRKRHGPNFERFPPPDVPPANECELMAMLTAEFTPFAHHIEARSAGESRLLTGGADPELVAWVRLRGAPLRPWQAVTTLLDALPPAMYAVATTDAAIPTKTLSIALTDHAHDFDPDEWALVRIRADAAAAGWVIETSTVWDARGKLLGYASQQRMILTSLH